ncbi:MAG: hypothetical protein Q8K52_01995 [Thiobacillus sp.]|nr:hypothetical protein [Thiobacillus sp.]
MKLPSFLRTLEIFSLIFVACCVVFLVTYLGYKYSVAAPPGYCGVQQRYISDEEFIKASVDLFEWKHAQNKLRWEASPNLYTSEIKWSNEILDQNRKQPGFIKVWRGDTQTIFRWLTGWQ